MSADIKSAKHVLVPINVEALVVGRQGAEPGKSWSNLVPDFSMLSEGYILGGQLTPSLETKTEPPHPAGVHLHWALPDALTHGRQVRLENDTEAEPSAPPEFPYIPNRWMVQRIWRQAGTEKIAVRAWIIESDYLYGEKEDPPADTVTFPKLDALPLYAHVGRHFDYSGWQEGPDTTYKIPLTALGYGDPAFAAYYPACKSLLGFYDELEQIPDNTQLTYMVAGWYSDAARDPLYPGDRPDTPAEWSERLGKLKWSTVPPYPLDEADARNNHFIISGHGDLSAQFAAGTVFEVVGETPNKGPYTVRNTSYIDPKFQLQVDNVTSDQAEGRIVPPQMDLPSRTLCHGLIYGIDLQKKKEVYKSQVPNLNSRNCRIAVGNSSGEALAALLAETSKHSRAEDLLTAFQGDILAHNTDDRELEALLHQNRFSSFDGGRCVAVRQDMSGGVPAAAAGGDRPAVGDDVTLSSETLRLLDELNQNSDRLSRHKRELRDYRWELFATWYKQVRAGTPDGFAHEIESLKQLIADRETALAGITGQIDSNRKALKNALQDKFEALTIVDSPTPPFWQANAPVVLVAAEGTRASRRHGRDGRYSDKDELHCRFSGQETTVIFVDIPNNRHGVKVDAATTFDILRDTFNGGGAVPMGVTNDLLLECLMLDPALADRIADQAYVAAGLSTRPGKDRLLSDIAALQRPESASVPTQARSAGILPSPIAHRDWQGNPWLPLFLKWRLTWHSSYDQVNDALDKWSFTGDGEDYRFTGDAPRTQNEAIYESYTLLTPHALRKFKDSVDARTRDAKHPEALEKIRTWLDHRNILSQFLGGLQDAFTMRDTVLQLPPIKLPPEDEIIDPISAFIQDNAHASPNPDQPFLPIRAGHAQLRELAVVDAFGQTVELDKDCLKNPVRARNLHIDGDQYASLIAFPPRVAQPLRLRFDWPPADNPETFPVNSPVCGWVMPNYLDKSLLFFDGQGTGLGAVQKILRVAAAAASGGQVPQNLKAFYWVPQPGTELKPADIPNPELKGFIQYLTDMNADDGEAFWRLLETALNKMDSGVPVDDPMLSVLVGRPLVLVRTALHLELAGLPAFDQALDKVGQRVTGGFDGVKFPLLLGDAINDTDGLVGYFRSDGQSGESLGPFYPAAGARDAAPLELDCTDDLPLTLLMDPLSRIHARTGILPKTYGELPHRWRSAAKTVQSAFFQTAPVISPGGDLRLPKPSDDFGKWSWAWRPQVTAWKEFATIDPIGDRAGFPPVRQELREGWLKLKLNPVAILKFGIREGVQKVSPRTNITLAWLLKNGSHLSLFRMKKVDESKGKDDPKREELWQRTAPFPEQYRVEVRADITYILRLSDDDGNFSEKQLTITVDKENT